MLRSGSSGVLFQPSTSSLIPNLNQIFPDTTTRRVRSTFSTVIGRLSRRFSTSTNLAVDSNDPCMCLRTFLQTKSSFINCRTTCFSATGNPRATSRSTSKPCRPTNANEGSGNYSRWAKAEGWLETNQGIRGAKKK